MAQDKQAAYALEALFWREEILQVFFWLQGEQLAEVVQVEDLKPLLQGDPQLIEHHLEKCAEEGYLVRHEAYGGQGKSGGYTMSEKGREEGGRLFAEAFAGMQKQGHGACSLDCECMGEGADGSCPHHHHDHTHPHP